MAPALARGPGAVALGQISVHGKAAINGVEAVGGGSVFSGDRLETQKESTCSVSMKSGDEVVLGELTSVEILTAQNEIRVPLESGRLEYLSVAAPPIVVAARGTEVVPAKGGGIYSVELDGDTLRVTASKGSAELKSANGVLKIEEGKTLVARVTNEEEGNQTTEARRSGAGHSKGRIVTYAITAAGIGGGVGLALSLIRASSGCGSSPSNVGNCESPH